MKLKFISNGKQEPKVSEVEIDPNKSVMEMAQKSGIEIRSICKGVPSCGECRVKIAEGENNVIPPNKAELSLIGSSYYLDQRRLSCQLKCFGPVTVDITEQLEARNDSSKKVRGFKLHSPAGGKAEAPASRAVQDTLVLDESAKSQKTSAGALPNSGSRANESSGRGDGASHRQNRNHNPNQNHQQNYNPSHSRSPNQGQNQNQSGSGAGRNEGRNNEYRNDRGGDRRDRNDRNYNQSNKSDRNHKTDKK